MTAEDVVRCQRCMRPARRQLMGTYVCDTCHCNVMGPAPSLKTPQGESSTETTREPVVTAPQGNAGESPAPLSSKEQVLKKKAQCPTCQRTVELFSQRDGYDRPIPERPFRFAIHAGTQFGRQCPNSGELER